MSSFNYKFVLINALGATALRLYICRKNRDFPKNQVTLNFRFKLPYCRMLTEGTDKKMLELT